jgi:menaquinol-cytochrome c reductase iron-sulfur subunit
MQVTGSVDPGSGRRGFLKAAAAVGLGAAAILTAPLAGLRVWLAPLRGRSTEPSGRWVRVTSLAALPEDGPPRRFPIVTDHVNAWTRSPAVPVGAVFVRRTEGTRLEVFNVVCPHAGCLVDYTPGSQQFLCPCHNSTFALDGHVNDPNSPSPRGLDPLEAEVRDGSDVWVRFQNFRVGVKERIPES